MVVKSVKDNDNSVKEADLLFAEIEELKINGENIEIKQFSWKKSAIALKELGKIAIKVTDSAETIALLINNFNEAQTKTAQFVVIAKSLDLLDEELIDCIDKIMSLGSGLDIETIENLSMDDGFDLAKKIYEVNKSFFMKRFGSLMKNPPKQTEKKKK